MLTSRFIPTRPLLGLAAAAVLALGACSDSTGPDDDHREPAGLRASAGGTLLVSVNAARQVTGSFTMAAGQSTGTITVSFLNDDGNPITPASDEYLRVENDGTGIVSATQNPGGAFTFTLNGLAVGTTVMRLSLMHGTFPGGHADYTSPNITVVVVQ